MGCEGMPQTMDSTAIGQPGLGHGAIEDVLARALVKGFEGLDAWKEKGFGTKLAVIFSEQSHQVIAQERVTLAAAFSRGDQQAMASAVQVLDPNMGGL